MGGQDEECQSSCDSEGSRRMTARKSGMAVEWGCSRYVRLEHLLGEQCRSGHGQEGDNCQAKTTCDQGPNDDDSRADYQTGPRSEVLTEEDQPLVLAT